MLSYARMVQWHGPWSLVYYPLKFALLPVARANRRRLRGNTVFVGVTGSAGKTTAKNLIAAMLGADRPTVASKGTYNSDLSLLTTLGRVRARHGYCVQEVGVGGPGSLDIMLWGLEPDVAVVTNVGWDHVSAFRSQDAIAAEKAKLVAALPPSGLAVLNADDPRVRAMAELTDARTLLYGVSPGATVRAEDVQARWPVPLRFTLVRDGRRYPVETRLLGEVWLNACLAALATAIGMGVPAEAAAAALAAVDPGRHRMSVFSAPNGVTFLQDDWKAAAWTVGPALEFLGSARPARRIAVIGQLSDDARKPRALYAAVAREARRHADLVVLVGQWAHHGLRARVANDDASIVGFATVNEAIPFLERTLRPGDVVLVKATRGRDHLERLVLAQAVRIDCRRTRCRKRLWCENCRLLTRGGRESLARATATSPRV